MVQLLIRLASIEWLPGWFRVRLATVSAKTLADEMASMLTEENIDALRLYWQANPSELQAIRASIAAWEQQNGGAA